MQHQSFARIEAHPETPLLPANLVAFDDETRTGRLHDFQRLYIVTESGAIARGIIAVLHRDVSPAIIIDAQNFRPIQVDHGTKSLDGMGVAVVILLIPVPAERVREPPAFLIWQSVIACRPGVDLNIFDVSNATFGQCRSKTRIGSGHFSHQSYVIEQDTWPHAGHMPPIDDPIRDEIDPGFPDFAIGPVESAHERLARKGRSRVAPCTTLLSGSCKLMVSNIMPTPRSCAPAPRQRRDVSRPASTGLTDVSAVQRCGLLQKHLACGPLDVRLRMHLIKDFPLPNLVGYSR